MFGLFSFQSKSHALTLTANTDYITTGHLLGVFYNNVTSQYNYFQLAFEGITNVGNISNGVIENMSINANLSGGTNTAGTAAYVLNNGNWDQILNFNISGTTSASLQNLSMSGALTALVEGIGNGFGSIGLNGTVGGSNFNSNLNSNLGYMPIGENNDHQPWDQFFNVFANNNLAVMIYPLDPTLAGLDAWFKDPNNSVAWYDYHVQLAAVPEPTTIGLLFSGLLGGVAARRKRNALIA